MTVPVKLNLGCGLHCIDGWVNVDNSLNAKLSKYFLVKFLLWKTGIISKESYSRKFAVRQITFFDITKKFPYGSNSVDYIYSSHTFEHIHQKKLPFTVMECYRVLKPGGTCRVVVPDLFEPARRYVDEYMKVIEEVKQKNYQAKVSIDLNYLYHNEDKQFDHQYMYDFITLARIFYKAGFVKIEEATPLSSKIPDIKSIEKRTDPVKNLYLECVKPA